MKGIDVSQWQGQIDWEKVKHEIDFAIIRIGYGKKGVDAQAERNMRECERLSIPYGVYWFSYAQNAHEAENEAFKALSVLSGHSPRLPVYFDFEYDSILGKPFDMEIIGHIADSFCFVIERYGYKAGIYTNRDWYKYFEHVINVNRSLWLASWGNVKPKASRNVDIWQYSSMGHITGISGLVDMDNLYNDSLLGGEYMRYKKLSDVPEPYKSDVQFLIDNGIVSGNDDGTIDMSHDMVRMCSYLARIMRKGK